MAEPLNPSDIDGLLVGEDLLQTVTYGAVPAAHAALSVAQGALDEEAEAR